MEPKETEKTQDEGGFAEVRDVTRPNWNGERITFWEKARREPWVPAGVALTTGILIAGIYTLRTGNKHLSQKLMRARLIAQGATVVMIMASLGIFDFFRRRSDK